MAKKTRRSYTPEFRAEAVALVVEGRGSQSQVARDLGISIAAGTPLGRGYAQKV